MSEPVEVNRAFLRYFGGKFVIARRIIEHFPAHDIYVEPFGGAASVLLRKERSIGEVYNDLDGEVVNLFRVARDRPDELVRAVELTPYARAEFDESYAPTDDPVEQARRLVVRSYMGYGGNLTRPNRDGSIQRTGFRDYSKKERRSIPAGDWRTWPAGLVAIIERLRGVIIEQRPAIQVMAKHDSRLTLHYVDPPYLLSLRRRGYRFEMSDEQHLELAAFLHTLQGTVIVSGYPSPLYDNELFRDWRRHELGTHADGARPRTEVLWIKEAA